MAKIRIASSPWGFRHTPLDQQCKWLKQLGLKYICGQIFPDVAGAFPQEVTGDQVRTAYELVKGHGLRYASFNASGDFMVAKDVEKEVTLACHQIDLASIVEPETIIVFAGWQDRSDEAVYGQVSAALKKVARHAGKYGLTVAMENHGGLTRTSEQVNRILKAVGERNIGVNYDPANYEMHGQDALEGLTKLDVPVVFTHFKSLHTNKEGKKEYCRLRDGTIDYPPILRALRDLGYKGFYTLEYEEPSDALAGTTDDLGSLKGWLEQAAS